MTPRFPWSPGPVAWQDDVSPLPPSEWNYDRAAHLLAHAGFGGTPEEIEKLADAGLERAVESLVRYERLPNPNMGQRCPDAPGVDCHRRRHTTSDP